MPFDDKYRRQVALLIRILPFVAEEKCFALKGGTAINLFYRDMPRLSVDIDLTYIPLAPRPAALKEIDAAMKRIAARIRQLNSATRRPVLYRTRADCEDDLGQAAAAKADRATVAQLTRPN